MKHSDEAVEKVLAGLRSVDAPVGMNRRILEGARCRAKQASTSSWVRGRSLQAVFTRPIVAWALACSLIIVTAVVVPMPHRMAGRSTHAKLTQAPPVVLQARGTEESVRSHPVRGAKAHLQSTTLLRVQQVRVTRNRDAATLRDMQVSYPAPPMPLTGQEKLLLRIVRKGDPVEMAMLDPDVRSRRNAEGKAEFQKFFEMHTQGDTK